MKSEGYRMALELLRTCIDEDGDPDIPYVMTELAFAVFCVGKIVQLAQESCDDAEVPFTWQLWADSMARAVQMFAEDPEVELPVPDIDMLKVH